MPILNKQNEYVIPITMHCNWNCSYCAIKNIFDQQVDTTYDSILYKIMQLPDNCICTLTGGEPGLVRQSYIEQYISLLKSKNIKIYLETNGLFLEKYPYLINEFNEILYHCSIDLCEHLEYFEYNNLRYILVLTDDNINNLNSYLKHNFHDIKFDFIPATYPYLKYQHGPILSNRNKYLVLKKYHKYMTVDSIKRFFKDKDFNVIHWLFK